MLLSYYVAIVVNNVIFETCMFIVHTIKTYFCSNNLFSTYLYRGTYTWMC